MTLVDRIFWEDQPTASNQALAALLRLWFVDEMTRAQTCTDVETLFTVDPSSPYTLTAGEKATLDEFKSNYDGKNAAQKGVYMDTVHATMMLAEFGKAVFITKPKFREINELT